MTKKSGTSIIALFGFAYLVIMLMYSFQRPAFMDELNFINNVRTFFLDRTILPSYTNYPTFFSYLISIPVIITYFISFVILGFPLEGLTDRVLLEFVFDEHLNIWIWVSRSITMVFALAVVVMVLKQSLNKFGLWAMLITASFFVFDPFGYFLKQTRYGLPDVVVAFFVTATVFTVFRFLNTKQYRHLYVASLLCGLAASAKMNGILVMFPLFIAPWLIDKDKAPIHTTYLKIILLILLGFFLGSPMTLFSFKSYQSGLGFESALLFQKVTYEFHGQNWAWVFQRLWPQSPGHVILIVCTVIYGFIKRTKEDIVFLTFFVSAFLILGALQKKTFTYMIILYPLMTFFMGRFLTDVVQTIKIKNLKWGIGIVIFLVIVVVPLKVLRYKLAKSMRLDNRTLARKWIYKYIPDGSSIMVNGMFIPTLYGREDTKFYYNIKNPHLISIRRVEHKETPYQEIIRDYYDYFPVYQIDNFKDIDYRCDRLIEKDSGYLITSQTNYHKFFSSRRGHLLKSQKEKYRESIKKRDFYQCIFNHQSPYRLIHKFDRGSGPVIQIFAAKF